MNRDPLNPNTELTDDAGVPKAADPANQPVDPNAVGGTSPDEAGVEPETSVEEQTRPFEPGAPDSPEQNNDDSDE